MNICERCGTGYRFFVDHGGHKLCRECWNKCSNCGGSLPLANKIGSNMSTGTALFTPMVMLPFAGKLERQDKPWIGSGLCMNCYHAKEKKEREEQEIIREAQVRQAREILESPTVWECGYCKTVNRGRFCANCGAPRKQEIEKPLTVQIAAEKPYVKSEQESKPKWYQEAMKQHQK